MYWQYNRFFADNGRVTWNESELYNCVFIHASCIILLTKLWHPLTAHRPTSVGNLGIYNG